MGKKIIIALPKISFCGINFNRSGWYSHFRKCEICKEQWKIYKNHEINKIISNWKNECECGCGKISPYGKRFILGHSRVHLTKNFIENRRKQFNLNNPMNMETSKVKISKFWTGRKRPYNEGENNPAKRPEIRKKIKDNNAMKNEEFRKRQKRGCLTDKEIARRSKHMKEHCPSKNPDSVKKGVETRTLRMSQGLYTLKNNWITGYYLRKDGTKEWYDSSYELIRMKYYDDFGLNWTKKHQIRIPYINESGQSTYYVPDFKVKENNIIYIDEIKGWINEKVILKADAAKIYCKNNGYKYRIFVGENLILNKSLSLL